MEEQLYFYHSLPRTRHNSKRVLEVGLAKLESICKLGLICTPQEVAFKGKRHIQNGIIESSITNVNLGVCLTAIPRTDLENHTNKFGPFSLEFSSTIVEKLLVMPVIYIPTIGEVESSARLQTSHLIVQVVAIQDILQQLINQYGEQFQVPTKLGPEPLIKIFGAYLWLLGLLTPTDNPDTEKSLSYYRQREWRIRPGVTLANGTKTSRLLVDNEKNYLINNKYFGKYFEKRVGHKEPGSGTQKRRVDWCEVIEKIDGKHILELTTAVYVPRDVLGQAKKILSKYSLANVNIKVSP